MHSVHLPSYGLTEDGLGAMSFRVSMYTTVVVLLLVLTAEYFTVLTSLFRLSSFVP